EVVLTYTIEDAAGAPSSSNIIMTVTGTNDKPTITDITPVEIQEDATVVTGNIEAIDVDDNATLTYSTTATIAGFVLNSDGSYSFDPANEAYQSLAKDERLKLVIPITATDDKDATDTQELTITVVGTNDTPTVEKVSESFILKNIRDIDGKVKANDIDGDTLTYTVSTQAEHGVVSVDENGAWYYKADGSYNGDDSAIITVDDGNGGEVTKTLNFTIQGYIYEGQSLVIDDTSNDDTLVMDQVSKDELNFVKDKNDLVITVLSDNNTITLKNYFIDTKAGVDTLQTKEGNINLSKDIIIIPSTQ
ncbi:MAG: Ig-like domain-containing protein, partial [Sulfurimonas sp.]